MRERLTKARPVTLQEAAVYGLKRACTLWLIVFGSYAVTTLLIHLTAIYLPLLFPEGFVLTMPW